MTIEYSLRRRATQSRWLAIGWLSLAIVILMGTYISLPTVASRTLIFAGQIETPVSDKTNAAVTSKAEGGTLVHVRLYAVTIVALGLAIVAFACFLLGRTAFIEIEMAARLNGLADALCIAGDNFERLEKAALVLVPQPGYLSIPEFFSANTRESFLEVVKALRKA